MAGDEYPEFRLRLPNGDGIGQARGVLLDVTGTNGSRKFLLRAGSPARDRVRPYFPRHFKDQFRRREELKAQGALVPSTRWPGWLELTEDVECGSPSFAANLLVEFRATGGWSGGPRAGFPWATSCPKRLGAPTAPGWCAAPT